MDNPIFRINDTGHGDGNGGEALQLLLMMNEELIDQGGDPHLQRLGSVQFKRQPVFHHQLAAEIAQRKVNFTAADAQ